MHRLTRHAASVALWVLGLTLTVHAQEPTLSVSGGIGEAGESVTATVELNLDGIGIVGYQFAVCHDPAIASIEASDVVLLATLNDLNGGTGPDFSGIATEEGSWRASVLVSLSDPALTLAAGGALYEATYTMNATGTSPLEFCDDGLPVPEGGSSAVVVLDAIGDSIEPATASGQLHTEGNWSLTVADAEAFYEAESGSGDAVVTTVSIAHAGEEASSNGFQGGVRHDPTLLEFVSVSATGDLALLNGDAGPSFFGLDLAPEGGPGATFAVIYSFEDPFLGIVHPVEGNPMLELTYDLVSANLAGVEEPVTTAIEWDDNLSTPAIPASVLVLGVPNIPNAFNGTVTLTPAAEFLRGDADGNGDVFPIVDALYILSFGFVGGPAPSCQDAADCDGNNDLFPIIDALYLLSWGFTGGPEPVAPGPFACGLDDDGVSISCDAPVCP